MEGLLVPSHVTVILICMLIKSPIKSTRMSNVCRNGKSEAKRFKACDMAPPNANKDVYASIFTSSRKSGFKETYSCRALPLVRN